MESAFRQRSPREPAPEREPTLVLLSRVRAFLCAIPVSFVVETMRVLPVRPTPGAAPFVRGLAIVRGEPVPVLDLGVLFGVQAAEQDGRFVTIRSGERHVALAVDAVLGVRAVSLESLSSTPPLLSGALPAQVERLGALDGQTLVVLSAARLFEEDVPGSLFNGGAP